jgi:hypothetical protein
MPLVGLYFAEGKHTMLERFVDHRQVDGKLVYACGKVFYFHRIPLLFGNIFSG